jgi:sugar phosphate isomerase/epimerase
MDDPSPGPRLSHSFGVIPSVLRKEVAMPLRRIAIAQHCFPQSLTQSLLPVAQSGAAGIEIDARDGLKPTELSETGRRQLLHRLRELNLSVASLAFPTRGSLQEPMRLDERISAVKKVMQFAYQLKAGVVTVRLGPIPAEQESEEYSALLEILNDLARFGNREGVTVALTPGRDSAEQVAQLLSGVTEGPIGVNFDPAVQVMSGHDPVAAVAPLHNFLAQVQVRDAVSDIDGLGVEVAVGRGEVVWDEFLALIDETGYRGWFSIDRTGGDDRAGDAARAVSYLKQVSRV